MSKGLWACGRQSISAPMFIDAGLLRVVRESNRKKEVNGMGHFRDRVPDLVPGRIKEMLRQYSYLNLEI